jgi:hypothetical protein
MHATCPIHHILLYYHPSNVWLSVQVMKLISIHSPPSCHLLLPLRSKYSPQHPVLKTPSIYVLLLVWETKFHTHTQQQVKLQFCVFHLYDFREKMGRQKILNWMVASVPEFNLLLISLWMQF